MPDKILFGYLSIFLVLAASAPYLYSILTRKTKPHIFTWVIWTIVTGIAAAAQFAGHAGAGAWATALTATLCTGVVVLSFTYGEKHITRSDWVTFICALSAIPLWYFTKNPLLATIVATLIDVCAYYPTLRKSYIKPHEEMIFSYVITNGKHIASIFAISTYSLTTVLYPATVFVLNTGLITMLAWRRFQFRSNIARH